MRHTSVSLSIFTFTFTFSKKTEEQQAEEVVVEEEVGRVHDEYRSPVFHSASSSRSPSLSSLTSTSSTTSSLTRDYRGLLRQPALHKSSESLPAELDSPQSHVKHDFRDVLRKSSTSSLTKSFDSSVHQKSSESLPAEFDSSQSPVKHDFRGVLRQSSSSLLTKSSESLPADIDTSKPDYRSALRTTSSPDTRARSVSPMARTNYQDFRSGLKKAEKIDVKKDSPKTHDYRSSLKSKPQDEHEILEEKPNFRSVLRRSSSPTKVDTFKTAKAEQKDFRNILKKTEASVKSIQKSDTSKPDYRSVLHGIDTNKPTKTEESDSGSVSECDSVIESSDFKAPAFVHDSKGSPQRAAEQAEDELKLSNQPLLAFDRNPINFGEMFLTTSKNDEHERPEDTFATSSVRSEPLKEDMEEGDQSDGSFVVHDDSFEVHDDVDETKQQPKADNNQNQIKPVSADVLKAISTSSVSAPQQPRFVALRRLSGVRERSGSAIPEDQEDGAEVGKQE